MKWADIRFVWTAVSVSRTKALSFVWSKPSLFFFLQFLESLYNPKYFFSLFHASSAKNKEMETKDYEPDQNQNKAADDQKCRSSFLNLCPKGTYFLRECLEEIERGLSLLILLNLN